MSDIVGKNVAGYPIEKLLTKVSFGEIYQATTSASPLAVRVMREDLREDAALNAAVAKGWEAARATTHATLVACYGAGVEAGLGAYCLEELIRGRSLRQIILDGNKMAWRDCLIVAEQLFTAVSALHAAKIIHGDIWAGATLITQDQDLKLEGAGGLMQLDRRLTDIVQGPALGYHAPEVLNGSPISAGSDIYSAGACLYCVLAGQDPYPSERAETLAQTVVSKKLSRVTALRDDLPAEADEFIERLMAHDPTQRYGNTADVLADISRMKDGAPLGPLKGGVAAKPPQFKAKSKSSANAQAVGVGSGQRRMGSGVTAASGIKTAGLSSQQKKISGFPAAVSSQGLASGTRVFGRLDTHVKSTIPQSETERRGDDLYRQGQLPLALGCWREAFESNPHTGLKVKLELGERDMKKEAYTIALDEARQRLHSGDFAGAIRRTNEALISAEGEQQRQDAISIEKQASAGLQDEREANKKKMMIGGGVLVLLAIIALIFIFTHSSKTQTTEEEEKPPIPVPTPGPTPPSGTAPKADVFALNIGVNIPRLSGWKTLNAGLAAFPAGSKEPAAIFAAMRLNETGQLDVFKNIQAGLGAQYKDVSQLQATDLAFTIDGSYPVAKLSFHHTRHNGNPGIGCIYLIDGPNHVLYLASVEGDESLFTSTLRDEADSMVRGLKFRK
jgi:serine/threonine-protein kinase